MIHILVTLVVVLILANMAGAIVEGIADTFGAAGCLVAIVVFGIIGLMFYSSMR